MDFISFTLQFQPCSHSAVADPGGRVWWVRTPIRPVSILSTCLKQKSFHQYNGIHLVNMKQLIFTGIEKNSSFVSGKK